jgi:putative transposase
VIITDKLTSYGAAKAEVLPSVEHLQQKYQNNHAENAHQPTRLRERVMRRFKSAVSSGNEIEIRRMGTGDSIAIVVT